MRILQISAYFYPSYRGTELTVAELCRGLHDLGHEVSLLTVNTEGAAREEVWLGKVPVRRCAPLLRYRRGVLSPEFWQRLLRARDYDIYHIHIPFHSGLEMAVAASRVNRIPLVANHHGESPRFSFVHGILDGSYRQFYRRLCLPFVDRTIFFTRSYPEWLGLGAAALSRVSVIRPAVDTDRFSPARTGQPARAKHGFAADDPVILCVSGLIPGDERRGVHYLIESMRRVTERMPRARLVIVGEGGLVPGLKDLSRSLGVADSVVFAGKIVGEELAQYYGMCDVFAFPTTYEPFGFVVQEAMASGKPVVVSDIPGVGELVTAGVTGSKVPPRDSAALAEALLTLLADRELRQRMGRQARATLEGRTWMTVAREVEQLYRAVLDGRRKGR